jgi:hypothetical protein
MRWHHLETKIIEPANRRNRRRGRSAKLKMKKKKMEEIRVSRSSWSVVNVRQSNCNTIWAGLHWQDHQLHECHKGLALHLLSLVYNQLLLLLPVQYSMSKISSSYIQGFKIGNKFGNDGHQDGSEMVSERRWRVGWIGCRSQPQLGWDRTKFWETIGKNVREPMESSNFAWPYQG